jgi:hypothetical protein
VAAGQVEHRRGGVGGDDAVPGGGQFPGEQATATAQFQDQPVSRSHRVQSAKIPGAQARAWKPKPQW